MDRNMICCGYVSKMKLASVGPGATGMCVYKRVSPWEERRMLKIYSKDSCPYCDKAKNYLKKIGQDFVEVNVTNDLETKMWLKVQGHTTVPQIYYKDQLLVEGGYTGLSKMLPQDIEDKKSAINQQLFTN
jgi:glutaredoxin-related protein